jgi:HK97 family phage portal protein
MPFVWPFGKKVEQRAMQWWGADLERPSYLTSGVAVNQTSALGLSAVYASVRLLADTISTLPIDAYLELGDDIRKPTDKPLWVENPGGAPWMNGITLLNQVMTSFLLNGNVYLLTPRVAGEVTGLVVLDPTRVTPREDQPTYMAGGEELDKNQLLHLRGLTLPGSVTGCSPITHCRESLGVGLAAQRFGGSFFGNSAIPSVIAEVPGQMSETGQKALRAFIESEHQGPAKAHKLMVLTEGAKLNKLTISPEDSQFIETRRFEVSDVARMFGVPPHLIGDASNSTSWGSGLAEQNIAFAQHSLRPWVERIETGLTALWHSEGGPPNGVLKLNMAAVLRGSTQDRYESYETALTNRFMTINEVRALEDLPPLPGGDEMRPAAPRPPVGQGVEEGEEAA